MKTVLVTGAARRLGAGLARLFARDGHRVVLHANTSLADVASLSEELNANGGATLVLQANLGQPGAVDRLMSQIVERTGAPDVIVNNASAFRYDYPGAANDDILRESLAVHVLAPVAIMEWAARRKAPDQNVCVFNILDQKLDSPNPDYFSYTIGKAGLRAATALWQTAARADFRVFGLLPGLMFPSGSQSLDRFAEDSLKSPLRRAATPEDIYAAMAFFIRHEGLPGQDVAIDGGESLAARPRDVAFE